VNRKIEQEIEDQEVGRFKASHGERFDGRRDATRAVELDGRRLLTGGEKLLTS
jgi:hypothetical protein